MITLQLDATEVAQLLTVLDIVRRQVEGSHQRFTTLEHQRAVAESIEMLWLKVGDAAMNHQPEGDDE